MTEKPPSSRRAHTRLAARTPARVVSAGKDRNCTVCEISAGGAVIECLPQLALGEEVALHVEGVGFFRGLVVRQRADGLCVELKMTQDKRDRLSSTLEKFDKEGRLLPPDFL